MWDRCTEEFTMLPLFVYSNLLLFSSIKKNLMLLKSSGSHSKRKLWGGGGYHWLLYNSQGLCACTFHFCHLYALFAELQGEPGSAVDGRKAAGACLVPIALLSVQGSTVYLKTLEHAISYPNTAPLMCKEHNFAFFEKFNEQTASKRSSIVAAAHCDHGFESL
jgi:hypothetical protein